MREASEPRKPGKGMPDFHGLLRSFHSRFSWMFLLPLLWRIYFVACDDATLTAVKQMEPPSHHSGAIPISKRQEVTAKQSH